MTDTIPNFNNSTVKDAVYMIYDFSSGWDAKRGFDVWLYLAYSSFVISYFLPNILYIRALIALGSCFFVVWSFVAPGMGVQIDTFCFNIIYVLINIYQIIRLLKKKVPPKFNELENAIYERDFKDVFSKNEFKMLINKSRVEYLSSNESQICKVGQSFKEIVYVADIHEGFTVELKDANNNFVSNVQPGSWIGIGEYAIREDYLKNPILSKAIANGEYELVWEISASIKSTNVNNNKEFTNHEEVKQNDIVRNMIVHPSHTSINIKDYIFLKKRSEGCIIYKFSIEVKNLFNII